MQGDENRYEEIVDGNYPKDLKINDVEACNVPDRGEKVACLESFEFELDIRHITIAMQLDNINGAISDIQNDLGGVSISCAKKDLEDKINVIYREALNKNLGLSEESDVLSTEQKLEILRKALKVAEQNYQDAQEKIDEHKNYWKSDTTNEDLENFDSNSFQNKHYYDKFDNRYENAMQKK